MFSTTILRSNYHYGVYEYTGLRGSPASPFPQKAKEVAEGSALLTLWNLNNYAERMRASGVSILFA